MYTNITNNTIEILATLTRRERLQQANAYRMACLAQQARQNQQITCRMLAAIGRRMLAMGQYLLENYSEKPGMPLALTRE